MNSFNEHNSTKDDTADHLIAFLVIIGAIAFILQQSLSSNPSSLGKQSFNKHAEITPKSPSTYHEVYPSTTYAEQRQAEKEFAENAVEDWTNKLEEQGIRNTTYRIPTRNAALITPVAAATPLVNKPKTIQKNTPNKLASTIIVEEKTQDTLPTLSKDQPVFIDTAIPTSKEQNIATKPASTIKQGFVNKQANSASPETHTTQEQSIIKKAPVASYEAVSPVIAPSKEQFVEKGITKKKATTPKKRSKKTTKKSVSKQSCAIVIAALQDVDNIKRLVKSLQADSYPIYNKRSGKYRAIGIKTSCNPSVYEPLLKKVQKNYAPDAWLKRH